MKTIVAIFQTADKGKTETLRAFANLLLEKYPSFTPIYPELATVPPNEDFRLIIKVKDRVIGIESQGDPNKALEERLFELEKDFNCDLILCATRSKGATIAAVEELAHQKSFDTIWTSTYQVSEEFHNLANHLKARHLLELLEELGRI